jgi:hypothetical protein
VAIQPDGGIVVVGETARGNCQDALVLLYTSTGILYGRFGAGGVVTYGGRAWTGLSITLQPGGRMAVTGLASNGADDDLLVVRFIP